MVVFEGRLGWRWGPGRVLVECGPGWGECGRVSKWPAAFVLSRNAARAPRNSPGHPFSGAARGREITNQCSDTIAAGDELCNLYFAELTIFIFAKVETRNRLFRQYSGFTWPGRCVCVHLVNERGAGGLDGTSCRSNLRTNSQKRPCQGRLVAG